MDYIQGKNRNQIVLIESTLDDRIDDNNPVRIIDSFVNSCNLEDLGFTHTKHAPEGRPPSHPATLLKLFIYGYLNRIRSSRLLERECKRNVELIWLLEELTPDHNTIANFRKKNPKAIKATFRKLVVMCKTLDLIGGKVIATDGSKFRAQNSKKNNYNQKKIEEHLRYIENRINDYFDTLDLADSAKSMGLEQDVDKEQIKEKIARLKEKKKHYKKLEKQLAQTGQDQISTTDPDSRKLPIRQNILEVSYNIQTSVDDKHCLPIDFKTTNNNDTHALADMTQRAVNILGTNQFTVLADKGYHTGSEISQCHEMGVETMVSVPALSTEAPDPDYNVDQFIYNKESDTYQCPRGNILNTNGSWYLKGYDHRIKQYKTKACNGCPSRNLCTKARNGRMIERSEFAEAVQRNKNAIHKNTDLYKRRQEIVEHPFGTIKRQWGFDYTLMKGKLKVGSFVGLIFIAYLFTRMMNILGNDNLKKAMEAFIHRIFNHYSSMTPISFIPRISFNFLNQQLTYRFFLNNLYFYFANDC